MRRLSGTPAIVVGVALGSVVPLLAVIASGRTLLWRDTARLYEPIRTLVVEALRSGRLPLWNPHEGLGQPILGQLIHGVLHPVSLLAAFLVPGGGTEAMVVAYVGLAGAGVALLVRALGASASAAVASGLLYAWSGYLLGMTSNLVCLAGGATAPWAVAALRTAGVGGLWMGALAVAAAHLAGDPQWTLAAVALGGALAFDAARWPGLRRAGGAALLGTGLAAVQLVPAWLALSETSRAHGLSALDRVQWALSPWRILELALPGLFGALSESNAVFRWLGGPTEPGQEMPFAPSIAIGAAALVLAVLGARAGRTGRILAWAAAIFLWLSLGHHAGARQLLEDVPVWGSIRFAEKLVGPLTLCLAVLAGLGLDEVGQGALRARWRWVAGGGVAALLVALVLSRGALDGLAPGVPAWPVAAARLARGLWFAGAGLVALGAAVAACAREAFTRWTGPTLAALAGASALAAAPFAIHVSPRGLVDLSWFARLRNEDGPVRIASRGAAEPYLAKHQVDELDFPLAASARHGLPPFTSAIHVDAVTAYTGLFQRRWKEFDDLVAQSILRWRAYRRLGLTHVVANAPTTPEAAVTTAIATMNGRILDRSPEYLLTLWEVPHTPWAHFASSVRAARTRQEAMAKLQEVLLTESGDVVLEAARTPPLASGRVLGYLREPTMVRVDVEASGPGLLVVADAFAPGWVAAVDDQEVPILPADVLARALPVPAGRHRVTLTYECPGLLAGAILSALALAALVGLVARERRRSREREEAAQRRGPKRARRAPAG